MSLVKAVLFGALQGLTEFLPISSSGHLAVFHSLVGATAELVVPLGVIAHLGTLVAVLIYFRKELVLFARALAPSALCAPFRKLSLLYALMPERGEEGSVFHQRLLAMIAVGTIPAGIAGLLFKDAIEQAFSRVTVVGAMFFVTAALLLLTKVFREGERTVWHFWLFSVLFIGAAQAVAIMPGISRSGATIAAGLFIGLRREFAARFSFLLSIPAIMGASLLERGEIAHVLSTQGALETSLVFLSAFAVGYASIALLLRIVGRGKLHLFGFYCLAAGAVTLLLACA
ncbi:MAG: undecaprenyl-diphosphate phosphatase [Candidatus Coatesbacteria bacterium]|nr:undecaprenyl-diphosphate phosphatase [Candidatus Coatesbacteria bacterium]